MKNINASIELKKLECYLNVLLRRIISNKVLQYYTPFYTEPRTFNEEDIIDYKIGKVWTESWIGLDGSMPRFQEKEGYVPCFTKADPLLNFLDQTIHKHSYLAGYEDALALIDSIRASGFESNLELIDKVFSPFIWELSISCLQDFNKYLTKDIFDNCKLFLFESPKYKIEDDNVIFLYQDFVKGFNLELFQKKDQEGIIVNFKFNLLKLKNNIYEAYDLNWRPE